MDELLFEETVERQQVLDGLEAIKKQVMELSNQTHNPHDRHRVRNIAQSVDAQKSLLIQDWHLSDTEKAA